ncbi:hypothetical protein ACE5D9_02370 [Rickettsia sp. 2024-CO-Wats]|uniref:hypothetical protein n=1 Tax=unclassified Rickettsia TaxID=114295 RepID=UPI00370D4A79
MLSVMHEQEALNTLQDLLNDSNIYIKATAVLSLDLIYIVPSLTLTIFSILKEVLNDSSNEVKIVVIWSLTETVRINPSLAQETLKIVVS